MAVQGVGWRPWLLAAACQSALSPALSADGELAPLVVSASRLGSAPAAIPAHVSIIEKDRIRSSPAQTLPELLALQAGVFARDLYGNGSSQATVDIRGFGATGTQNTLILVNGRRLNDVDLAAVDLGTIPLHRVERIEVLRSGGSVLYGAGAAGGAINIITRPSPPLGTTGEGRAGVGSHDAYELGAALNHHRQGLSASLDADFITSDGYRDNNELEQASGRVDLRRVTAAGEAYLHLATDDRESRLPGPRTVDPGADIDELDDDRRGSGTPNDYADDRGWSVTAGLTQWFSDQAELVAEITYRDKEQDAFFDDYQFDGMFSEYWESDLGTWSFTPRVNLDDGAGRSTVAGLDYHHSAYDSSRAWKPATADDPVHVIDIKQRTLALYAQAQRPVGGATVLTYGARLARVEVEATDRLHPDAPGAGFETEAAPFDRTDNEPMFTLGLRHGLAADWSAFAKVERSVRFATVDEMFEYDPETFARVFSPLEPQTGVHMDMGVEYQAGGAGLTLSGYHMNLRNEIHFRPDTFTNENLDPTRRYGFELSGRLQPSDTVGLQLDYAYTRAVFRDGPFDGNNVPLVPRHSASLQGSWRFHPGWLLTGVYNYVGERYFDNDQSNDFGQKMPDYHTVDLRLTRTLGPWRVSATVNNLFDEEYYEYGVRSLFTPGRYNAYPLPERRLALRVSREW